MTEPNLTFLPQDVEDDRSLARVTHSGGFEVLPEGGFRQRQMLRRVLEWLTSSRA